MGLAALFKPVLGTIVSKGLDIIDDLVPDKDLAAKLKAAFKHKILDQDHSEIMALIQGRVEIILAEAKGGILQRNWRPILMLTIVFIVANTITDAVIYSTGETKIGASDCGAAEGSGGAGGTIYLIANNMSLSTVQAVGGEGANVFMDTDGWGGNGSDGRIRLDFNTLTGVPDPESGYNGTPSGMQIINTTDDTPLWTTSSQPQTCGSLMGGDSICQLNWSVNATTFQELAENQEGKLTVEELEASAGPDEVQIAHERGFCGCGSRIGRQSFFCLRRGSGGVGNRLWGRRRRERRERRQLEQRRQRFWG